MSSSARPAAEILEPRIQFADLALGAWAYSLPIGYGPASTTVDVINKEETVDSQPLRLKFYLTPFVEPGQTPVTGSIVLADNFPLGEMKARHHGSVAAAAEFDMDAVPAGKYNVGVDVFERTFSKGWEPKTGLTFEVITVLETPFPGASGTSFDGKINGHDAGDTLSKADNLGTLPAGEGPKEIHEEIIPGDIEYYRFTLSKPSAFNAEFIGDSSLDFALLDPSDTVLAKATPPATIFDQPKIAKTLEPGTYYLRVMPRIDSPISEFRLSLSAIDLTPEPTTPPTSSPSTPTAPTIGDGNTAAPFASFKGPGVARKTYRFTVIYTDDTGVDATTIDPGDVLIEGPNGFSQAATIVKKKTNPAGTKVTVTCALAPPRGLWYASENGTYEVSARPHSVSDSQGLSLSGRLLGRFTVKSKRVEPTTRVNNAL